MPIHVQCRTVKNRATQLQLRRRAQNMQTNKEASAAQSVHHKGIVLQPLRYCLCCAVSCSRIKALWERCGMEDGVEAERSVQ